MITIIIQLLTLISDRDIKFFDKLRFLPLLVYSLVFSSYRGPVHRTFCLDGLPFYYLGIHKNIMLDHLISHLNVYKKYYRQVKVVVDVGASFGTFPRITNYFNPQAKFFCIEMARQSFELLKRNTQSQSFTKCFRYAMGDRKQNTKFYFNSDYPEGSLIRSRERSNSSVNMITLDDFVAGQKITQIDILKVDTEGFELKVIKGADHVLKITDLLILEIDFSYSNLTAVTALLSRRGFRLINFGEVNFNHKTNMIGSCDLIFSKIKQV